jgi:endonuclease/exonuclease/phosphatase family metal-dependent hydrolase
MNQLRLSIFIAGFVLVFGIIEENNQENVKQTSITIMSYNIRYDNPGDGINAWANRKNHVADMMAGIYKADIIGVQEALRHQLDDLQDRMTTYSWVGVGRDDGRDRGEFSPIFYSTERFELVATNTFWLSETPHMPGSKSWDAAIARIATWAKFKDLATNGEFYVVNTHFDHIGETARLESAKMITAFVEDLEHNLPVVVTGDFNVPESSKVYSVLTDFPKLSDARYASNSGHKGPTASFSDWEILQPEESRIDYIFVSDDIKVESHLISDDKYNERFPSDHLPVVAKIELR